MYSRQNILRDGLHDEQRRLTALPRGLRRLQVVEHLLEAIAAAYDEHHVLDEIADFSAKFLEIVAVVEEPLVVGLHLAMPAQRHDQPLDVRIEQVRHRLLVSLVKLFA